VTVDAKHHQFRFPAMLSTETGRRSTHQKPSLLLDPDRRVRLLNIDCPDSIGELFESDDMSSALVLADACEALALMPDATFRTCITSPPYWSLRDYKINAQIGLESSVEDYVKSLVAVFMEVHRVLRNDGTLWVNVGDSFTSGGRTWRATDKKNPVRAMNVRPPTPEGLKPKDLIGVPWRLAFALQQNGWYLRADIIWNKPNCQPESVKDRPTRCHEYIFLFSKSERYYYDHRSVRGPNNRNLRTVWDISTRPYPEAHFATFPPALVEPCVSLGTKTDDLVLDPFVGAGTTGLVALNMKRRFVGIELNPEYLRIAERRLNGRIVRG
jgi:DNA modification methylase